MGGLKGKTRRKDGGQLLKSTSGYQIHALGAPDQDLLTVTAPDGQLCLSIALRPDGPVVEVHAQSLRFASRGLLQLDCERLVINATGDTALRTGTLTQEIAGAMHTRVGGTVEVEAHAQRLRARRGDIQLHANDDVTLDGERVLLNSPRPATPVAPDGLSVKSADGRAPGPTPLFGLVGGPVRRARRLPEASAAGGAASRPRRR